METPRGHDEELKGEDGHCHQKAEVGTAATVALLRRIPGAHVTELDVGYCGMAGSFGFEDALADGPGRRRGNGDRDGNGPGA
ncbi:hypothetical protein ABTY53_27175 [Streptomyces noursei]|uniref:hypothetical protein n=1 Tax=Streptomyces noursei TaxID=1971 RepID=UPI00331C3658